MQAGKGYAAKTAVGEKGRQDNGSADGVYVALSFLCFGGQLLAHSRLAGKTIKAAKAWSQSAPNHPRPPESGVHLMAPDRCTA